jgi:hypothetical protein
MNLVLTFAVACAAAAMIFITIEVSTTDALFVERCHVAGGTVLTIGGQDGVRRCVKNIEYIYIK